jgi:hypothetical protein
MPSSSKTKRRSAGIKKIPRKKKRVENREGGKEIPEELAEGSAGKGKTKARRDERRFCPG